VRFKLNQDIRTVCILVIILLSDVHLHYLCKNTSSCLAFWCSTTSTKIPIYSSRFSGKVTPLVCKSKLRRNLVSKSEKCKNIEARLKVMYSYKKGAQ